MGKKERPDKIERHQVIAELKAVVHRLQRKIDAVERIIGYLEDEESDEIIKNSKDR